MVYYSDPNLIGKIARIYSNLPVDPVLVGYGTAYEDYVYRGQKNALSDVIIVTKPHDKAMLFMHKNRFTANIKEK